MLPGRGCLLALTSLALAGSLSGACAPGITHTFEVVSFSGLCGFDFSPDSTRLALGVAVDEGHPPNDLGRFPDGGGLLFTAQTVDVLVYDLARRKGPARVARLRRTSTSSCQLVGWVDAGIVFRMFDSRTGRRWYVAVDPASGRCESLRDEADPRFEGLRARSRPNLSVWQRRRVMHVDEEALEFFLWHPESRQGEFLFALPLAHDGHRDLAAPVLRRMRLGSRRIRAIHRIWDAQAAERADSIRFLLETYVPTPGNRAREYRLLARLELPPAAMRRCGAVVIPLWERRIWLPANPAHLDVGYARADLLEHCRRCLGAGITGRGAMEVTSLSILLKPISVAGEDTTSAPGVWEGDEQPVSLEGLNLGHRPAVLLGR